MNEPGSRERPDDTSAPSPAKPDPPALDYRARADEPRRVPQVLQFFMGGLLAMVVCVGALIVLNVFGSSYPIPGPSARPRLGRAIAWTMLALLALLTVRVYRRRRWIAFTAAVVIVSSLFFLLLSDCGLT